MDDDNELEQAWIRGNRAAWARLLQQALGELGYDSPEAQATKWIIEREEAIVALRDVCGDFGDNDWSNSLNLADVIEKHLTRHLHEGAE